MWRVINLEGTDIYTLHATEYYFVSEVSNKRHPKTIIFSRLGKPAVSIGKEQNLELDVDLEQITKSNIDLTRRNTGGRSVFFDDGCYIISIIKYSPLPKDPNDINIHAAYREACSNIIKAIKEVTGIDTYLANRNDLVTNGKRKIGSSALQQFGSAQLVHCYIRHSIELETMLDVLKIGGIKLNNYKEEFRRFVSSVNDEIKNNQIGFKDFSKRIMEKLVDSLEGNIKYENLTNNELIEIKKIATSYKNKEIWKGTGKEPSRGTCDLVEGDHIIIEDLRTKIMSLVSQGKISFR